MRGLLLLVISITFSYAQTAQTESKAGTDPLRMMSESSERLAAKVSPSVVKIIVTGYGPVQENGRGEAALIGRQHSIGSGLILDRDGYIVTNAHVVAGAQRVRVSFNAGARGQSLLQLSSGSRPRTVDARIVGVDKVTDLAILKVEEANLPTLALASYGSLRQGQMVFAFGTPEDLDNTVTMGVVSSVLRQLSLDSTMVYIQTDAAINPGNSGGPLVDVDGNVVGINTAIFSQSGGNEGIGFAIPSLIVSHVYQEIRRFGHVHHYEIGARLQTITPTLASGLKLPRDHGVIVADVEPEGPADNAGLARQDIIIRMNGFRIEGMPTLSAALYLRGHGDAVAMEVLRGSERKTLTIRVVEQDKDLDNLASAMNPEQALVSPLGILGIEIDSKLVKTFPDLRIKTGIIVAAMSAGPSVDTGLETGDVIHSLNTTDIASLDGLRAAVAKLKSGDPVVLLVERDNSLRYLSFDWE
jgi:serine protease Do